MYHKNHYLFMPRIAPQLFLTKQERKALMKWKSTPSTPQKYLNRIDIVLLAADGQQNDEISSQGYGTISTISKWRSRYFKEGIEGLKDSQRTGRPYALTPEEEEKLIALTLSPPPDGLSHWSSRTLSEKTGIPHNTITRCWKRHNLKPHRISTFKYSKDPELEAKIVDVVGLYLNPPEKGFVVCVDEKTQIQAIDRTQTALPMRPGSQERQTHDYIRNGKIDLFAALDISTGEVVGQCRPEHKGDDFLAFLKQVRKSWPYLNLHIICDNLSTHKCPQVMEWVEKNKRIHIHFTPTSASWMNQIEIWFSILQGQMIKRSRHGSVKELISRINKYIDGWNKRKHPFVWTKTAENILKKAKKNNVTN